MQIRQAVVQDAPQIADVHVLGWQVGYRGQLPQPVLDSLDPADRIERWTRTVRRATWPTRGTLVADDDDGLVGFADLRLSEDPDQFGANVGELVSFYVLPAVWRRGIGKKLIAATESTFRMAGFDRATLWVLDTNRRAIDFYERMGWRADGATRDDVVGDARIRDLRYGRSLDGPGHHIMTGPSPGRERADEGDNC